MSWIADYDTQGREFPTCVHVTKTTGTMTHGATYVPIEDGKAVRDENAKLREQMERLVTLLRNDCDIEASWDGMRRFWSIELTEDGCLMRDRACKAEAENAKLRELDVRMFHTIEWSDRMSDSMYWPSFSYKRELRELGIEVD